tara:strand:- start:8336 stop:8593 length:258 start_codon:yes stop_codon:yes gene_type:complete
MREQLQEGYSQPLLFADGFDKCIIGVCDDFGTFRVVYSVDKMIESLMSEGDSYEDAREYLEFNTLTAWVGDTTPIYVESDQCFTD